MLNLLNPLGLMRNTKQQRKFFDQLAKSKGFNPLDVEKWYAINVRDIKGAVS
jgi:hypothetical protein